MVNIEARIEINGQEQGEQIKVKNLVAYCCGLWWECSSELPLLRQTFSFLQRLKHQRVVEDFRKQLGRITEGSIGETSIAAGMTGLLQGLEANLLLKEGLLLKFFQNQGYDQSTSDFLKMVEAFDPGMEFYDIFQAIRNVWIMNSIQILFGMEVRVTPSVFAYSMLYPYSDNYLDDESIPQGEKLAFNQRFKSWLLGEGEIPDHPLEKRIYDLIKMIEGEYSRNSYPQVYESLLAIHRGQEKSLTQQRGHLAPYERDLLSITFEKGGTSVLADGYLVRGHLTYQESLFLFQYGVLLQLIDDLQDCGADQRAGHMTLFSMIKGKIPLDTLVNKLWHLIPAIMETMDLPGADGGNLRQVISQCCEIMILEAMAHHSKGFTKGYLKQMNRMTPLPKAYFKGLKGRFQRTIKPEAVKGLLKRWLQETQGNTQNESTKAPVN